MAISAKSYFTNAIVGLPQIGGDVDIYETHANPRFALGTKFERADGSIFRYSHFGLSAAAGCIVGTDEAETSVVDTDNVIVAPSSTYQMPDEFSGVYPGAIGSRYVIITLATVTEDQYMGAYFVTTDDTGEGYTYRILGNTATGNPVTGKIRLRLDKPLKVALAANTDFAIQGCGYSDLEYYDPAGTGMVNITGVTTTAVSITTKPYGWVQTAGVCGLLQDGAIAIGEIVTGSDGVPGAVQVQDAFTESVVGFCLISGDDTGYGVFKINLE